MKTWRKWTGMVLASAVLTSDNSMGDEVANLRSSDGKMELIGTADKLAGIRIDDGKDLFDLASWAVTLYRTELAPLMQSGRPFSDREFQLLDFCILTRELSLVTCSMAALKPMGVDIGVHFENAPIPIELSDAARTGQRKIRGVCYGLANAAMKNCKPRWIGSSIAFANELRKCEVKGPTLSNDFVYVCAQAVGPKSALAGTRSSLIVSGSDFASGKPSAWRSMSYKLGTYAGWNVCRNDDGLQVGCLPPHVDLARR